MYISPYLSPLHLPASEATRCKFVYNTAGLTAKDDNYRGKFRYRFNKWRPISASMPRPHSDGMIFSADQEFNLSGIVSAFEIPHTSRGSINFLFGPTDFKKFDLSEGDSFEMGIGFLKYTTSYWGLAQGCEFLCVRRYQPLDVQRRYFTLNNQELPTLVGKWDPNRHAGFTLYFESTAMTIAYTEYTDSGIATYSDTRKHIYANNDNTDFHVVFYMLVSDRAHVDTTLVRTFVDIDDLTFDSTETIYFRDQPTDYEPPIAPLRDPGLHVYNPPHVALIEDATLTVGAPTVSPEWWGILKFLVSASPETCVFTDPDGTDFRVCFQDLTSKAANLTGYKGIGYDLTMAVMVPH